MSSYMFLFGDIHMRNYQNNHKRTWYPPPTVFDQEKASSVPCVENMNGERIFPPVSEISCRILNWRRSVADQIGKFSSKPLKEQSEKLGKLYFMLENESFTASDNEIKRYKEVLQSHVMMFGVLMLDSLFETHRSFCNSLVLGGPQDDDNVASRILKGLDKLVNEYLGKSLNVKQKAFFREIIQRIVKAKKHIDLYIIRTLEKVSGDHLRLKKNLLDQIEELPPAKREAFYRQIFRDIAYEHAETIDVTKMKLTRMRPWALNVEFLDEALADKVFEERFSSNDDDETVTLGLFSRSEYSRKHDSFENEARVSFIDNRLTFSKRLDEDQAGKTQKHEMFHALLEMILDDYVAVQDLFADVEAAMTSPSETLDRTEAYNGEKIHDSISKVMNETRETELLSAYFIRELFFEMSIIDELIAYLGGSHEYNYRLKSLLYKEYADVQDSDVLNKDLPKLFEVLHLYEDNGTPPYYVALILLTLKNKTIKYATEVLELSFEIYQHVFSGKHYLCKRRMGEKDGSK